MPSWDTLVIGGTSQQRSLASAMDAAGHKVRIVSGGLDALAPTRWRPDLVLIDLHMPAPDGLPTTMLLRGLELDGRHVPIIATGVQAQVSKGIAS